MSDQPSPDETTLPPPTGAPIGCDIEGILEGRVADAASLRAAVDVMSTCHAGRFRLEITGGRFNVLPEETSMAGAKFDDTAQAAFLDALRAVVAAAVPGSIEMTLRCKLSYADQIAETLFVLRDGQLQPLTRRRPSSAADAPPLPYSAAGSRSALTMRRRELLWLAPLLLLAGLLLAWQVGWIDRVLAARAEDLLVETGPFGGMIAIDAQRQWGNYEIVLRRGPEYPTTPDELAARRDRSSDLPGRAATALVGDGGELFVQVQDAKGRVLVEQRAQLRPLLSAADGKVFVRLPGQIAAHSVCISLDSGKAPK